jgi:hypothetical protein
MIHLCRFAFLLGTHSVFFYPGETENHASGFQGKTPQFGDRILTTFNPEGIGAVASITLLPGIIEQNRTPLLVGLGVWGVKPPVRRWGIVRLDRLVSTRPNFHVCSSGQ